MNGRLAAYGDYLRRAAWGLVDRLNGRQLVRSALFRKYVSLFLAVITIELITNGLFEVWFSYREHRTTLVRIQQEQAESAASKITQFIKEIEGQLGWTTQLAWSAAALEQRRFDGLRLLRQVPAITELSQIDDKGFEKLRVSRLAMDVVGSQADFSKDPKFTEALAQKTYYGPVYFRRESEPYMTLAMAGTRRDSGVSVAEVNLKFIWDVVTQIRVGQSGQAFVVDAQGRLVAHPDISLVLRNTDMSQLAQVKAARDTSAAPGRGKLQIAEDVRGQPVLTAHAVIAPLGWLVFVELPVQEANAPLWATAERSGLVLLAGLSLALLSGLFLAQRMVVPIQALSAGAIRIGSGNLEQRIAIKTGDELEELADSFNQMSDRLRDSYADLEGKVEDRTRELAQSVGELRALGEVSQAVNSTLEVETVLSTIVAMAVRLSDTDAGAIYDFDEALAEFELRATYQMPAAMVEAIKARHIVLGQTAIGKAAEQRTPVQVVDLRNETGNMMQEMLLEFGFRALLAVPILGAGRIVGCLVVRRKQPGEFPQQTVDLLQTFAAQSVLALQNARLFREIEEKSRQLEIASLHKSQFLANMSHELRTPLNAILGYTELIIDGVYGAFPEKARQVLDRVQVNGKHLLGLINDVLDLTKIEAGHLTLTVADYDVRSMIDGVVSSMGSLAKTKGLELRCNLDRALPEGRGDERRLKQVLLNLVGNALKFTDTGYVEVAAEQVGEQLTISVRDSGPGIAEPDQKRIFEEFQQVDTSSTREKGGSGLGLAISRRIVELHGGKIAVHSIVGAGSTFTVEIPLRIDQKREAA